MKIIDQSYTILNDDILVDQIASKARICYKSEDKAKSDETAFLKKIWDHQPVFEMAVVTLEYINIPLTQLVYLSEAKYLHVTMHDENTHHITGSVRAWNEHLNRYPNNDISTILKQYDKFMFRELETKIVTNDIPVAVIDVDLTELSEDAYNIHKYVAVHFITNRAVTHELVRHRPVAFLQESQRYVRYDQDKFGNEITFINPKAFFQEKTGAYQAWKNACEDAEYMYMKLINMKGVSAQSARTVLPNSTKTELIMYCNLREWEHIFARRISPAAEPSMREIMIPLHKEFVTTFKMSNKPKISK